MLFNVIYIFNNTTIYFLLFIIRIIEKFNKNWYNLDSF